jgi:FkbM family methyltransferase
MKFGNKTFKNLLYTLLEFVYVPIICGKLRGKLWTLGSGGKILKYITTTYEPPLINLFEKHVSKGNVVYDIGSHAGYFTLYSSYLVGEKGRCYAFEPNKRVYRCLIKNIKINKRNNVFTFNVAVSDKEGYVFFKTGKGSGTGKISSDSGEYKVEVVKLDDFVVKNNISPPNVIKVDVEGEELNVLKGAKNLLTEYSPLIFLSAHSQQLYDSCCEFLKSLGYEIKSIQQMRDLIIAFKNKKNEKM